MNPLFFVLFFSLLTTCASHAATATNADNHLAGSLFYSADGPLTLKGTPDSDLYIYMYFLDAQQYTWWFSYDKPAHVFAVRNNLIANTVRTVKGFYTLNGDSITASNSSTHSSSSNPTTSTVFLEGTATDDAIDVVATISITFINTNKSDYFEQKWKLQRVAKDDKFLGEGKPPCQSGSMLAYDIKSAAYECHYDHGFTGKDASGWPENLQYAWSRIATVEVCEDKKDLTKTMLPILVTKFGYGELVHDLNGISFHSMQIEKVKNFCSKSRIAEADKALPFFLKGIFPEAWPSNDAWMTDKKPTTGQPSTSK